jgi:hypothetical protein
LRLVAGWAGDGRRPLRRRAPAARSRVARSRCRGASPRSKGSPAAPRGEGPAATGATVRRARAPVARAAATPCARLPAEGTAYRPGGGAATALGTALAGGRRACIACRWTRAHGGGAGAWRDAANHRCRGVGGQAPWRFTALRTAKIHRSRLVQPLDRAPTTPRPALSTGRGGMPGAGATATRRAAGHGKPPLSRSERAARWNFPEPHTANLQRAPAHPRALGSWPCHTRSTSNANPPAPARWEVDRAAGGMRRG